MEKSIVIIGGGMAGLAAGCYARMNGYRATIFELHDKPGGLCTSWKRKGYVVDGCIHWLVGSSPAVQGLHRCWQELGLLKDRKFIDHEVFMTLHGKEGKTFNVYTDIDRLEQHLLELSPQDQALIREFTGAVRKFMKFDLPLQKPNELRSGLEKIKGLLGMAPFLYPFLKYSKLSIQDFAQRFKDPFLKRAFAAPFDLPDFPLIAAILTYGWMSQKSSGYPIGGSLELARASERRFLALGGQIQYRARVERVLVEGGRAVGVRLVDGTEHRADLVISAADGHATIFDLLQGKYLDEKIKGYYDQMPRFKALIQASFGIDRDLSAEPTLAAYELDSPLAIGGETLPALSVHNYSHDPTMAPKGKAVVVFRFFADYAYWKKLKADPQAYETEKQKIADALTGFLESRYPGVSEQIEMIDIATPTTFENYTANWEGSMEGWLITTKSILTRMPKTLPGLKAFYMVGQWVAPGGGLPSCAITAREVLQLICHEESKPFTTSIE